MKRTFVTLVLAVTAIGATAQGSSTIRFGVDPGYAPFESKSPDGKLVGFDIDLGDEICRRLRAKCAWVENDFDAMIPALKAKKFDGILSSMTVTPQRAEQVGFSNKLFESSTRLIAKQGVNLQPTAESLKGKTVGVQQGTIQETFAKNELAPKGVQIMTYQNQDLVYADLITGRLDASLQDQVQGDIGFLRTPRGVGFSFSGSPISAGPTAIGMRKEDTALKEKINGAITAMVTDGTYAKIERKYFSYDVYGK
ncbi:MULTISPECIES: transporter substrate-binding domain-containing protein [unclassified Caballeronia]|uniref:transporter substrate-binding domain-containing protein n=1 Tax=unclassified Caballeronia TaxID=2646786 RepID=UPI002029606B|nr:MULTISPECIES: transporter substrate-binding domain-containing protein [unclassified Caballeronia]